MAAVFLCLKGVCPGSRLIWRWLFELFEGLFAILLVGDGQDHSIRGNDAVIGPKVSASQSIKGGMKPCKFFNAAFAKG